MTECLVILESLLLAFNTSTQCGVGLPNHLRPHAAAGKCCHPVATGSPCDRFMFMFAADASRQCAVQCAHVERDPEAPEANADHGLSVGGRHELAHSGYLAVLSEEHVSACGAARQGGRISDFRGNCCF